MLDILQSIPILGFLSITVTGFIALFPGNLLGMKCAAMCQFSGGRASGGWSCRSRCPG